MVLSLSEHRQALESGRTDRQLTRLYGGDVQEARQRILTLLDRHEALWGQREAVIVSAPGRTELGGNHTDHNHGCVLAAAIHLDCLAVASRCEEMTVSIRSKGFDDPIEVDLSDTSPREQEHGTSEAIVRGVAHGLAQRGFSLCGFTACVDSSVPMGAGLSSSAAFEVLVCSIFNHLANHGQVSDLDTARIARRAENVHFGKPCGFMDQIACAHRGVLHIDFKEPDTPVIRRMETDLGGGQWQLAVVDTGGSHADLTPEYAAIPAEMVAAAKVLGHENARQVRLEELLAHLPVLRQGAGDRAVLRLMHFLAENRRAGKQAQALAADDVQTFLRLVAESGESSWKLLQNVQPPALKEQPIPLALALSQQFLQDDGVCRVHGGGFAGTIQVYVRRQRFAGYAAFMDGVFGSGATIPLSIRSSHGCLIGEDS